MAQLSRLFGESLDDTAVLVERVYAAPGQPMRLTWANDTLIGDTCDRAEIGKMEEVRGGGRERGV